MAYSRLSDQFYTRWVSEYDDGLTDGNLIYALELVKRAGFERSVFFERTDEFGPAEFIKWAREHNKLFFILFRSGGTPLAAIWFTGPFFAGTQAAAHFCTFSTGDYHEYVSGGRLLLRFIGDMTQIKQAIGITPACYRHALKLAYDLGFKKLDVLKRAVSVRGKNRDAVLSINNISALEV